MNMHKALRIGFLALVTMIASTMVFAALPSTSIAAAIGDWEGTINTSGGSLRVIVHISQAADGKLAGTLDSPDQGTTGAAIDSVTYNEPDLHFAIERFGSNFDGKMKQGNSEIAGEWKQSGLSLPLVFKRRGK